MVKKAKKVSTLKLFELKYVNKSNYKQPQLINRVCISNSAYLRENNNEFYSTLFKVSNTFHLDFIQIKLLDLLLRACNKQKINSLEEFLIIASILIKKTVSFHWKEYEKFCRKVLENYDQRVLIWIFSHAPNLRISMSAHYRRSDEEETGIPMSDIQAIERDFNGYISKLALKLILRQLHAVLGF
ncbi:unnamed protein product [Blepharisma stoltei]|uniref:Uncharacterized protein n=1 Tax=Blepharisma stoltei TaxID=1481888 RepID=A0AAU9IG53_9CILI|nr:unnamed protein product [Blepharisma stoltei]